MNKDILDKSKETKTIKIELSADEHKKVKENAKRKKSERECKKKKINIKRVCKNEDFR